MDSCFSLTPINLALDGSLEYFIELYQFTYDVYLRLLDEHPSFRVDRSSDRQHWNSCAIPELLPKFELLAFRRLRIFTAKFKSIHLYPHHFKNFDFFDGEKLRGYEWRRKVEVEWASKEFKPLDKSCTEDDPGIFAFQETVIGLDSFLEHFKRVVLYAIYEEIKKNDPSYTIFQARKDVDDRIWTRMKMRRSECIVPNNNSRPPIDSPLFLYDALSNIGCNRNQHELIPKKYYARHTYGKNTVVLPVHYCKTCNRYLCGKVSFALFEEFFGKFIIETHRLLPGVDGRWQLQGESRLHQLGYNVIDGGLTCTERKNILISLLESKQLSFFEIVATLEQNIRTFESNYRMRNAVEKWHNDLKFISDYMMQSIKDE